MQDNTQLSKFAPVERISVLQGVFYVATGVWPLISRRTFEKVTGPKVDFWLVKTIGGLITVLGSVLIYAGLRRQVDGPVALLAVGSAASLTTADIAYVTKGRISPVYLLDALAEIGVMFLWIMALRSNKG